MKTNNPTFKKKWDIRLNRVHKRRNTNNQPLMFTSVAIS